MAKIKNNEEMLIELIKTNSSMLNAILRERIVAFLEMTKNDIEKNPENWNNGFIDSSLYLDLYKNVNNTIGFNK
ncbi:hypothetical protein EBU24_01230 [bacterium]|nr:hypothetical protein [bacterium]